MSAESVFKRSGNRFASRKRVKSKNPEPRFHSIEAEKALGELGSMQPATRLIEHRRRKIGGRASGGREIGSASFWRLSVAKSPSGQSGLSTAAPFGPHGNRLVAGETQKRKNGG